MTETLTITKENGESLNVNIISCFMTPESQKQFIITTTNEIDPNGLVVLCVSEILNGRLNKILTDEDWNAIKQVMRSIISSSAGTFKYIPLVKNFNAPLDYARNISVQSVAKDQLIKDYYEKRPVDAVAPQPGVSDVIVNIPPNPAINGISNPLDGNVVAQGIVEIAQPNPVFQATPITENPTDLILESTSGNQPVVTESVVQPEVVVQQPVVADVPVIQSTEQPVVPVAPSAPVVPEPIVQPVAPVVQQAALQPVIQQPVIQAVPNVVQQTIQQPVQQTGMNLDINTIVADAKEVFLESAKNLADVIVAKAFETIKIKEEELRNREIIVSQREAAINQQTMMNMNQYPQ